MIAAVMLVLSLSAASSAVEPFTDEELKAYYYADLGPATIDVAAYPKEQQEGYRLFAAKCAQCHTLARAVNSHITSRVVWKHYLSTMRLRAAFNPAKWGNKLETKAIEDFLVFDAKKRKIDERDKFEELTEKLQRRLSESIDERWRRFEKAHAK